MLRIIRVVGIVLAMFITLAPAHAQKQEVDLMLVLASDVSGSVDAKKFKLQRDGYLAAIQNPKVITAMTGGATGRIALMFAEWSSEGMYKVVVDWQVIDGTQAAQRFADSLVEAPRSFSRRTSISYAIDQSVLQIERAPFTSSRRVIDISGDGTNNDGRDVKAARDEAVVKDIRINGLVILSDPTSWMMHSGEPEHVNPPGGLEFYYHENVIGGFASFVAVAANHNSFGDVIVRKMILEIAQND